MKKIAADYCDDMATLGRLEDYSRGLVFTAHMVRGGSGYQAHWLEATGMWQALVHWHEQGKPDLPFIVHLGVFVKIDRRALL